MDERSEMIRPTPGTMQHGTSRGATQTETQAEDLTKQAAGAVENVYSKTVSAAVEGAQSVSRAAVAGHDFLRDFMEENPHTTTVIALGIGLLIGGIVLIVIAIVLIVLGARARPRPQSRPVPDPAAGP